MPYITETGEVLKCEQCCMKFGKGDLLLSYESKVFCDAICTINHLLDLLGVSLEELTPKELNIGVTWVGPMVEQTPLKGQTSL